MKTQFQIFIFLLCISIAGYAQELQKDYINYQGVVNNASGDAISNMAIALQIDLKFGSATAASSYVETHPVTTDANGVFSIQIGARTLVAGSYSAANWGSEVPYYFCSKSSKQYIRLTI